jgi:hypothetical protein
LRIDQNFFALFGNSILSFVVQIDHTENRIIDDLDDIHTGGKQNQVNFVKLNIGPSFRIHIFLSHPCADISDYQIAENGHFCDQIHETEEFVVVNFITEEPFNDDENDNGLDHSHQA